MAGDEQTGVPQPSGGAPEPAGYGARPPLAVAATLGRLAAALWIDVGQLLKRPADETEPRTVWVLPAAENLWQRTADVSGVFIHQRQRPPVHGLLDESLKSAVELAPVVVPSATAFLKRAGRASGRVVSDLEITTLWVTQLLAASRGDHGADLDWSVRLTDMPVLNMAGHSTKQQLAADDLLLLAGVVPSTVALVSRARRRRRERPESSFPAVAQWLMLGADGLIRGGGVVVDEDG